MELIHQNVLTLYKQCYVYFIDVRFSDGGSLWLHYAQCGLPQILLHGLVWSLTLSLSSFCHLSVILLLNRYVFFFKNFFFHCSIFLKAPSWAYLQAALGLFFYQTLDAIDGKQARRTGSSSPLGELFDHGCDSMTQG